MSVKPGRAITAGLSHFPSNVTMRFEISRCALRIASPALSMSRTMRASLRLGKE
jgi:hypothetical protein